MNTTLSTALSGMQAAQTQAGAAGHNLANLSTPGFKRQTVQAQANPQGGVQTALSTASHERAAPEADVVGLMQAKHSFAANLAVFKASDRMMGALLDTHDS